MSLYKIMMSSLLGFVLAVSCAIPIFAEDGRVNIMESEGVLSKGDSEVTYKVVKAPFYLVATIPIEIPIVIDTNGVITVPDNLEIQNHTYEEIEVKSITINDTSHSGYGIVSKDKLETSGRWGMYYEFKDASDNVYTPPDTFTTWGSTVVVDTTGWTIPQRSSGGFGLNLMCTKETYGSLTNGLLNYGYLTFTIAYANTP